MPPVRIKKRTHMHLATLLRISGEGPMPEWNLLLIIHSELGLQGTAIVGQQEKAAVVIVPQRGPAGL